MNIALIISLIFIQGLYDFIGWRVLLGGADLGTIPEKIFRVVKFVLDFPVTIYLTLFVFDFGLTVVIWFYILKWFHSCDRVYNWLEKIFYKSNPAYWGYWRWWTFPLGIIRTNWFNVIHLQKGYTYEDYIYSTGHFEEVEQERDNIRGLTDFRLMQGMVNINEANKWNNAAYITAALFNVTNLL